MRVAHKHLPHYTYKDYCQWGGNWEVIEGIPYAKSPAPVPLHQLVNMNLGATFVNALKKGCEKCKVYMPIDWKVTEDTIVQPDLLIVCKEIQKKFLDFPPVLVVEIISPSSAFNDRNLKKEIYLSPKVKYYLIIDPQNQKTEVWQFSEGNYISVPVMPSNFTFALEDDCTAEVNLADIWE